MTKKSNNKTVIIINVYRPPAGDKTEFIDQLNHILHDTSKERYADYILLGDVNIDHTPSKATEITTNLINMTKLHGMTQLITEPTRRTCTTNSILDVIYVKSSKIMSPLILHTAVSDHYLVGCTAHLDYKKDPQTTIMGRSYKNYTLEKARSYYNSIDRSVIYEFNDVDLIWAKLKAYIVRCADKYCPLRRMTIKQNQPKWFTTEMVELIHNRDQAFLEASQSADPQLLIKAKDLRTKAKQAVRNARRDYIKSRLHQNINNPQKFWRELNLLLKRKASTPSIELKNDAGTAIQPSDIPNYINSYFATIGPKLAEQFTACSPESEPNFSPPPQHPPTHNHNPPYTFPPSSNTPTGTDSTHRSHPPQTFDQLTENMLLKEVKATDINKSSGIPGLSSRLIKDAMIIMISEFTFLFNTSLLTCKVPSKWKEAIVIPIPKIANSKNVSDLRPISLLPIPGKMLEHIIHDSLMNHLDSSKLLSRRQFGFRPGLSTVDAITTLVDDVGLYLNNSQLTLATIIDFRNAFDTLDHNLLLKRLAEINLSTDALNWFRSYLSQRSQTTMINGLVSHKAPMKTGVPQGSILGPLLFIIYVNNLPDASTNSKTLMYADDTVVYTPIDKNLPSATLLDYQKDLNDIAKWCYQHKLSINETKTQIMVLGTNSRTKLNPSSLKLYLNNTLLTCTDTYKYLGVLLNPSLTLTDHINKIFHTVYRKINTLAYPRKTVGQDTSVLIYKTTILPHMEYCNVIHSLLQKRTGISFRGSNLEP